MIDLEWVAAVAISPFKGRGLASAGHERRSIPLVQAIDSLGSMFFEKKILMVDMKETHLLKVLFV